MSQTAIVILNWNGAHFLQKFLPSVLAHSRMEGVRVVIADNGSTDHSAELVEKDFPEAELIRLDKNYGFTGGYNRALKQISADYYLLLNSDIEVPEGWLEPLIRFMDETPGAAAVTPKIMDYYRQEYFEYAGGAGGFIDRYGYAFCRGRVFDKLEEDHGQFDRISEIFWGSGACLLVRAELFHAAGGLDEDFFAHMEEIDLCWRLKRMGYTIYYHPGSKVWHVGGGTLSKSNPAKTYLNFRNNLFLLYKNLPPERRKLVLAMRTALDLVSALRFLFRPSIPEFKAVVRAHRDFIKNRSKYRGIHLDGEIPKSTTFAEIYPASVVLDFFLLGHKTFDSLRKQFPGKVKMIK
ncbi:MAG: glycosyltransferase family 2 protein [Bacteroidota bacterium]